MRWYVLLTLGVVVLVYLLLGGVAFHFLEKEEETGHKAFIKNFTDYFLEQNGCLDAAEFEFMVLTYIEAFQRGIIEINNKSSAPNWDMASSVFFSITVITTIGYGNIYPITDGGQAFCVVYALLGIPLCLIFLTGIGEKLNNVFKAIDRAMDICNSKQKKLEHGIRISIILLIGLALFLFIPAIMFIFLENWTYLNALYYSVITLTTIGFGDLVPGAENVPGKNRSLYRIMVGLWIFVGLAWLAGVISYFQNLFAHALEKAESTVLTKKEKSSPSHTPDMTLPTMKVEFDNQLTNEECLPNNNQQENDTQLDSITSNIDLQLDNGSGCVVTIQEGKTKF